VKDKRRQLRTFYERIAQGEPHRDTDTTRDQFDFIERHTVGRRILDLGCGRGTLSTPIFTFSPPRPFFDGSCNYPRVCTARKSTWIGRSVGIDRRGSADGPKTTAATRQ
jgi:hypothetical protein